jgi:protein-disulfide isomerase
MEAIARVQGDTERLVELWLTSPKQPIVIRQDDPVRSGTGTEAKTVELVVFSDFQCPSCARFAALVDESIAPLFGGRLRVVFKHYPINRACNPLVSTTMHKNACRAAQLAEAARVQGGADAFWRAHDHLFQRRRNGDELGTLDPLTFAKQLGLDGAQLAADADAEIVGQRIKEDAELARKCHVRGTPAVFVEARRVDPLAISDLRFWDRVADWFWRSAEEERPNSTKLGALNPERR